MRDSLTGKYCPLVMACLALMISSSAQEGTTLAVMPLPASVQPAAGWFTVDQSLRVAIQGDCDSRVSHAVSRFFRTLSSLTGIPIRNLPDNSHSSFVITCAAPGDKIQTLGEDESYHLKITPAAVQLDAPNSLGILHGLQTFQQLVHLGPNSFTVAAATIDDQPRFPWRGLLIDVSRHFMPVDVIERNLDAMEAVKFNVLHWHLSDDQGFRVESKKFPKLQELGSDGMYYTQDEIKEVIQYARDLGIRVMPEFDIPGHSTSMLAAYPELASGPGPFQIQRKWGIFGAALDPTRESTYHFLGDLIEEMARLFPDQYFHIGGDEVNGKAWSENAEIQDFMQKHGIRDHHDLQAYFNQHVQEIVTRQGKIMVGWDEILHPDLPKETVVQSWRGQKSLAAAARQGYRGLLSFGYYLDLMRPASSHYAVDPLGNGAADLTAEEKRRILGGEACMWAEFVTSGNLDGRIWPRAAAVAERLWSPENVKLVSSMYMRLETVSEYLDFLGIKHNSGYRLMLERLAGGSDVHALRVLADVLEPVKEYAREATYPYDSLTPLNRLVDTVHPESEVARRFAGLVERYLNHASSPADLNAMEHWLKLWQSNDEQVDPVLQSNSLLREAIPLSQNLKSVAAAGLQALDYLSQGGQAPGDWRQQQLTLLRQAAKPQAELLNLIVPAVGRLVAATTTLGAQK